MRGRKGEVHCRDTFSRYSGLPQNWAVPKVMKDINRGTPGPGFPQNWAVPRVIRALTVEHQQPLLGGTRTGLISAGTLSRDQSRSLSWYYFGLSGDVDLPRHRGLLLSVKVRVKFMVVLPILLVPQCSLHSSLSNSSHTLCALRAPCTPVLTRYLVTSCLC